jgi:hypothetical protein
MTRVTKRRATLPATALLGMILMGCNTASAVDCDPATIGYVESRLNVDYRALAPSPVAEILSQAEAERIAQSGDLSGSQRNELATKWRRLVDGLLAGTLPGSFTGTASEPSLDELRALTPNALALLQACGPDADARLAYLRDISLSVTTGLE